jgi:hypothetical protein
LKYKQQRAMFTTIKIQIMGNQGLCSKQELNEYLPTYLIYKSSLFLAGLFIAKKLNYKLKVLK